MQLKIKATEVLLKNRNSKARVILNEGSSRSSKTYSLAQFFFIKMMEETGITITCVRKTLPALKGSAYKDFLEVVRANGTYDPKCHNKTDLTYVIGENSIEFISVDNFDKVKGRKRDYLWVNEANELEYQDFVQLALRTTKQIVMDYNPSHEDEHWIEKKIKTRDDYELIHSTYKDNPFLDKNTVFEIERLQETDPNLWRIYGLGIRGIAEARIFTHFQFVDALPEVYDERIYGVDFGFNNETACGEVRIKDDEYYCKELIYEKGLTNTALIAKLKGLGINGIDPIYCDSAEPQRIQELREAGFNAMPANKEVKKGIDTVKSKKIYITKDSLNALKESKMYSWKVRSDGTITDEPVKAFDHFIDGGIRYPIHSHQLKPFIGFV